VLLLSNTRNRKTQWFQLHNTHNKFHESQSAFSEVGKKDLLQDTHTHTHTYIYINIRRSEIISPYFAF